MKVDNVGDGDVEADDDVFAATEKKKKEVQE